MDIILILMVFVKVCHYIVILECNTNCLTCETIDTNCLSCSTKF